MSAASAVDFGPIATVPYDFTASWTSSGDGTGMRGARFAGTLHRTTALQLSELVASRGNRRTIGSATGILEYVDMESVAVAALSGWYLLQGFDMSPAGIDPEWPYVTFSLSAVYVGEAV